MKKYLITTLLLLIFSGCQGKSPHKIEKPLVVTSIPPYSFLVEAIAGDTVDVTSALGANFDPHSAEITPVQMGNVQQATLFIGVGEPYEKRLLRAMQKSTHVLEITKEIPLLSYAEDGNFVHGGLCANHSMEHSKDLHVWLSPQMLVPQVDVLVRTLSALSPENSAFYEKNGKALIKRIKTLNQEIEKKLYPFQKRAIIVSHPVLGYFCRDYNLVQIAVECEGKSPRPQNIHRIVHLAENSQAICVFIAPQFNNQGAEAVAHELDLRVETFDPLSKDLLETIEHIANTITN